MTTSLHMKFPDEFAELFKDRSEVAGCYPAQRVIALERLAERNCSPSQIAQEIAQVRAEAEFRHRDGARRGGRVSVKP